MAMQYLVGHWAEAMEDMNADSFKKNLNDVFSEEEHEEEHEEEEGLDENE